MSSNDVFIYTSTGWRSLQGPPGPEGPAGASPSMMGYTYVDTPTVTPAMAPGSPIADGEVTVAPSQTTATTVTVATMSLNGTDVTVPIDAIKSGDTVYLAEAMEPECRQVYLVTGDSVMYDGYAEIPVDWQMAGPDAPLTDGEEVYIAVIRVGEPGPEGPSGPMGPVGGAAISGWWQYHNSTDPPPLSGQIRSSASGDFVTLYIHHTDDDGLDWSSVIPASGDTFALRDDSGNSWVVEIDTVVDDVAGPDGYSTITGLLTASTGLPPAKNARVQVSLVRKSAAGGDKTYIHTQSTIDTTWTVNHGLGKYPAIMVVDSGGNWLLPDVTFVDANTVQLDFSAATFGKAYVN